MMAAAVNAQGRELPVMLSFAADDTGAASITVTMNGTAAPKK
jgi:hypothetical protein